MDDEMIERCTLAAHNFNVADGIAFNGMPDHYKNTWRRLTIAVIKAMREPTKSMLALGEEVGCWPEVIDYIINE